MSFVNITKKEKGDYALAIKLRRDGVITSPELPFKESDKNVIYDLISRGLFKFELSDRGIYRHHRIFKSRIVRNIKGKNTKTSGKFHLVR